MITIKNVKNKKYSINNIINFNNFNDYDNISKYIKIIFKDDASRINYDSLIKYIIKLKSDLSIIKKESENNQYLIKYEEIQKLNRERQILKYLKNIKSNNSFICNNNSIRDKKYINKITNYTRNKISNVTNYSIKTERKSSDINSIIGNKCDYNNITINNNFTNILLLDSEKIKNKFINPNYIKYINYYFQDIDNFKSIVKSKNYSFIYEFKECVNKIINEHQILIDFIIKFKEIFETSNIVLNLRDVDECLLKMVKIIVKILNCDRSSIFIYDSKNNNLWSRINLKTDRIIIPMNKGLVGKCFNLKKYINIKDAYKEKDFDPTTDKNTGYITKSILCMPIFDTKDRVIGILIRSN